MKPENFAKWVTGQLVFVPGSGTISIAIEEDEFVFRSPVTLNIWFSTPNAIDAWEYINTSILWRGDITASFVKGQRVFERLVGGNSRAASILAISQICFPKVTVSTTLSFVDLALRAIDAGLKDAVTVGYLFADKFSKIESCLHPAEAKRRSTMGGTWLMNGNVVDNLCDVVVCNVCGAIYEEEEEEEEEDNVAAIVF